MGFWLRRLGRLVVVLVCVSFFSYFLLDLLPGDPVTTIAAFAPESVRDRLREDAKLDQPIYVAVLELAEQVLARRPRQLLPVVWRRPRVEGRFELAAGFVAADAVLDDAHGAAGDPTRGCSAPIGREHGSTASVNATAFGRSRFPTSR